MQIYIAGNILVEQDSLPLKLLPKLSKQFPQIDFIEIDPHEDFMPTQQQTLYIIDTVLGVNNVCLITELAEFKSYHPLSLHDYDLLFHLQLLHKLGRLPSLAVIAVPPNLAEDQALAQLITLITRLLNKAQE